jgi:hypothetical protein
VTLMVVGRKLVTDKCRPKVLLAMQSMTDDKTYTVISGPS